MHKYQNFRSLVQELSDNILNKFYHVETQNALLLTHLENQDNKAVEELLNSLPPAQARRVVNVKEPPNKLGSHFIAYGYVASLHEAKTPEAVDLLLKHGADLSVLDSTGRTAAHTAFDYEEHTKFRQLLAAGIIKATKISAGLWLDYFIDKTFKQNNRYIEDLSNNIRALAEAGVQLDKPAPDNSPLLIELISNYKPYRTQSERDIIKETIVYVLDNGYPGKDMDFFIKELQLLTIAVETRQPDLFDFLMNRIDSEKDLMNCKEQLKNSNIDNITEYLKIIEDKRKVYQEKRELETILPVNIGVFNTTDKYDTKLANKEAQPSQKKSRTLKI